MWDSNPASPMPRRVTNCHLTICGYIGTRTQTNQRGHQLYGNPTSHHIVSFISTFHKCTQCVVRTGFEPASPRLFKNHILPQALLYCGIHSHLRHLTDLFNKDTTLILKKNFYLFFLLCEINSTFMSLLRQLKI